MVGNVVAGALRSGEVLDRLASKPLWTGRAAEKLRRTAAAPSKAYGVGLACVSTVFGSGSDPAFALVEIDPAGRITLTSQAVEIGTGIATALAVRLADKLGAAADAVTLAVLDGWDVLGLVTPDDPFTITREQQDAAAKNPRWVPDVAQDTTASISAHVHTAVAAEAANVILRFGLWPAAKAIWSAGPFGGQAAGEFVRVRRRALRRRPLDRRRHGAAGAPAPRRQGARDGPRRRRDGARLQSLVLGACHLRSSRRALRGRDRRARRQVRRRRSAERARR